MSEAATSEKRRKEKKRKELAQKIFSDEGQRIYLMNSKTYSNLLKNCSANELDVLVLTMIAQGIMVGKLGSGKLIVSILHTSEKIFKIAFGGSMRKEVAYDTGLFQVVGEVISVTEMTLEELRELMRRKMI